MATEFIRLSYAEQPGIASGLFEDSRESEELIQHDGSVIRSDDPICLAFAEQR
jgi:hypothetical protein